MVELQPSKLVVRVRFPSPAPVKYLLRCGKRVNKEALVRASCAIRARSIRQPVSVMDARVAVACPAPDEAGMMVLLLISSTTTTVNITARALARSCSAAPSSSQLTSQAVPYRPRRRDLQALKLPALICSQSPPPHC